MLARWIHVVMPQAGIDVNIFKAHSVRLASVSVPRASVVPVKDIIERVGWSKESTNSTRRQFRIQQPTRMPF